MEQQKGMAIWYCDTEEEFEGYVRKFDNAAGFKFKGDYDMIQDYYFEMEERGYPEDLVDDMTRTTWDGDFKIEIIEWQDKYTVYTRGLD